jgi:hypothetical protein
MKVDPDNRLIADTLETEWNEKLRLHAARLCVSPRNLATYRSWLGRSWIRHGFRTAANDPNAAPTEMMPRLALLR